MNGKRQESRGAFQHTSVGCFPADWGLRPIGSVGRVLGGRQRSPNRAGTPCRYLRVANVFDGVIDTSDVLEMPFTQTEREQFLLREGDILLNEGQSLELVGRSAIYRGDPPECCFQNTLVRFRPGSDVITEYARLVFQNYLRTGVFASIALKTTSIAHLGAGRLARLEMPVPPLAEQHAIAEALSDVDGLLGTLEKLIAKKRAIKQAAMQQLLRGETRLPGFRGEWDGTTLGEIGECIIGLTYRPENVVEHGLLVLRSSNIQDGRLTYDDNVFVNITVPDHLVTRVGDLLVCVRNGSRALIGKSVILDESAAGQTFGAFMSVYRTKYWRFIGHAFQSHQIQRQIRENIGATINQITNKDMKSLRLMLPGEDEQTAIATVLSDMDAEIEALEHRREKARQIKLGMMQQLLTGRIRLVKPVARAAATPADGDTKASKPHSWAFNEAVVISMLAKHFGKPEFPLGRKRYTKLSYLLHRHAEKRAEGYLKKAAGPYNPKTKYGGPERIGLQSGYIRQHKNGPYTGFVAGDNIAQAEAYFEKWYGPDAIQWLNQFRFKKNDDLELLTTVDMAAEELHAGGKAVDVASVEAVIRRHPEWQAKLDRPVFSDRNIAQAINDNHKLFGQAGEVAP